MAKPVESSQFLEVVGLYPRDTGSLTTDSVYFDLKGAFVIDTMNGLKINSGAGNQVGGFTIAGTMTLTGALTFSPDNTYDIGASGATRPRSLYLANSVTAGSVAGPAGIITYNGVFTLSQANSGGYAKITKSTAQTGNPGTDVLNLYVRDGTNGGTLKLVVRAGAAGAETTVLDNIPQ